MSPVEFWQRVFLSVLPEVHRTAELENVRYKALVPKDTVEKCAAIADRALLSMKSLQKGDEPDEA